MEPTYVHIVRATYENPQSAGLAAGPFLKVKTGVLQCTTGDSTQDALIRDHIDSMLLDVTRTHLRSAFHTTWSTLRSSWGPRRPWQNCMKSTSRRNVSTNPSWTRKRK